LAEADNQGEATPFIAFMLQALRDALQEALSTTDQVTDQVAALIHALKDGAKGSAALVSALELSHRPTLRYTATSTTQPNPTLPPDRKRARLASSLSD
jgi:hypothetical protein